MLTSFKVANVVLFFFPPPSPRAVPTSPSLATGLGINPAALPHLLGNAAASTASQQLLSQQQQLLQAAQAAQQQQEQQKQLQQQQQQQQATASQQQPLLSSSPKLHSHRHAASINHYTVGTTFTIRPGSSSARAAPDRPRATTMGLGRKAGEEP